MIEAQIARGHDVVLVAERDDGAALPCEVRIGLHDLDAIEADVVHIHNALAPEVLTWAAQRGAVATVQDHRSFCPGRGKLTLAREVCDVTMSRAACAGCFDDSAYFGRIYDTTAARLEALRNMRAVTVLSPYMKRALGEVGVDAVVIPPLLHGLDPTAPPAGPPCVLFVGRLVEAKGVRDALAAWRMAETTLPLVFAGSGTLRGELESEGCEVLGWRPHAEMSAIYRRARALIVCSRWQEPYGIVGPEALAHGVSVAAWDSGGVASWHPGGLVSWGDVNALAGAIDVAVASAVDPQVRVLGTDHDALMAALHDLYTG